MSGKLQFYLVVGFTILTAYGNSETRNFQKRQIFNVENRFLKQGMWYQQGIMSNLLLLSTVLSHFLSYILIPGLINIFYLFRLWRNSYSAIRQRRKRNRIQLKANTFEKKRKKDLQKENKGPWNAFCQSPWELLLGRSRTLQRRRKHGIVDASPHTLPPLEH